jgi:hypothetical protein
MAIDVNLEHPGNPEFTEWYDNQNQDREDLFDATLAQTIAQFIQLGVYYTLAEEAIDSRDAKIDAQWAFMQKISDYECGPDYEMLQCKKDVLTQLELPTVDMCSDIFKCTFESELDGVAVDAKSEDYASKTCKGIPNGWKMHDGDLFAAQASANIGGLIANSARRQQERFRQQKTDLVRSAQQGMKGLFNANSILAKYAQGAAIHSGLADLFIQGFNSAGAGLGVSLGRLSSTSATTFAVGGNAGGASTGLFGFGASSGIGSS